MAAPTSYHAKEPDSGLIAADGEVADGVAVAVEYGGKGIAEVADGLPAAGAVVIHWKIIVIGVSPPMQNVASVLVPRPSAAAIDIKVQVPSPAHSRSCQPRSRRDSL